MNNKKLPTSPLTPLASRCRGIIEPISAIAVAGMVVMMGGMMAFMVWGMPKMMGMMHGGHDEKSHEEATEHGAHATKAVDPVCGMEMKIAEDTPRTTHEGKTYYFCSGEDLKKFLDEPEKYAKPGDHERK
ncbi:MAG: YHS domain-containing protein [Nitrospirae bacterium]|nr:YHS domain-containing protein [Nitrospirota bacterium]